MGKKNPMPEGRYEEVMLRDFHRCQAAAYGFVSEQRCGNGEVVHHRVSRGMGGSSNGWIHDAELLVVLCTNHHLEVHSHPLRSYECGLMVRR